MIILPGNARILLSKTPSITPIRKRNPSQSEVARTRRGTSDEIVNTIYQTVHTMITVRFNLVEKLV